MTCLSSKRTLKNSKLDMGKALFPSMANTYSAIDRLGNSCEVKNLKRPRVTNLWIDLSSREYVEGFNDTGLVVVC